MYKKFKDCLLAPRKVADYIDEPKKKTLGYLLILLCVYLIPLILISIFSNPSNSNLSNSFAEDLMGGDQINYQIVDGELIKINESTNVQFIKSQIVIEDLLTIDALYVFDISGAEYKNSINIESDGCIVFLFSKSNLSIISTTFAENESSDVEYLANTIVEENKIYEISYSELKLGSIDFLANKDTNSINFKNDISKIVNAIYDNIKMKLLPLIIIIVIIIGVNSYFVSILFITFLYKLLYAYLRLPFNKVFKAVLLCSTPYVICSIIASLTGLSVISLVGDVIMIFYVNRALTTYKIKYDGGVPLPSYMQHMMDKKEEEKGDDNNEL